MHHIKVTGMSCGHCVAAIEKAVKGLDSEANVSADIEQGEVSVESDIEFASTATRLKKPATKTRRLAPEPSRKQKKAAPETSGAAFFVPRVSNDASKTFNHRLLRRRNLAN